MARMNYHWEDSCLWGSVWKVVKAHTCSSLDLRWEINTSGLSILRQLKWTVASRCGRRGSSLEQVLSIVNLCLNICHSCQKEAAAIFFCLNFWFAKPTNSGCSNCQLTPSERRMVDFGFGQVKEKADKVAGAQGCGRQLWAGCRPGSGNGSGHLLILIWFDQSGQCWQQHWLMPVRYWKHGLFTWKEKLHKQ